MKFFEILGITDRGNEWKLKVKEYTVADTPNFADLNRRGAILCNGCLVSTYARLLIRKTIKKMSNENPFIKSH